MSKRTRLARFVCVVLITGGAGLASFALASAAHAEPSPAMESETVIGDRVWHDKDSDGTQEVGEPGLNGVVVQLLDKRGVFLDSTSTATNGNYRFENRKPGVYQVRVVAETLPDGMEMTHDRDGGAADISRVKLRRDEVRLDLDFGYHRPAKSSVHDLVWIDADGDGERDKRERGLAQVEVVLFSDGEEVARDVTRRNGYFRFDWLAEGRYEIAVDPDSLPFAVASTDPVALVIDGRTRRSNLGYDSFGIVPLGD